MDRDHSTPVLTQQGPLPPAAVPVEANADNGTTK